MALLGVLLTRPLTKLSTEFSGMERLAKNESFKDLV